MYKYIYNGNITKSNCFSGGRDATSHSLRTNSKTSTMTMTTTWLTQLLQLSLTLCRSRRYIHYKQKVCFHWAHAVKSDPFFFFFF